MTTMAAQGPCVAVSVAQFLAHIVYPPLRKYEGMLKWD